VAASKAAALNADASNAQGYTMVQQVRAAAPTCLLLSSSLLLCHLCACKTRLCIPKRMSPVLCRHSMMLHVLLRWHAALDLTLHASCCPSCDLQKHGTALHENLIAISLTVPLAYCCCAGNSRDQHTQQHSGASFCGNSSRPPSRCSGRHYRCRRLLHRLCHVWHHHGNVTRQDHAAGSSSGGLQVHSTWRTAWAAHTPAAVATVARWWTAQLSCSVHSIDSRCSCEWCDISTICLCQMYTQLSPALSAQHTVSMQPAANTIWLGIVSSSSSSTPAVEQVSVGQTASVPYKRKCIVTSVHILKWQRCGLHRSGTAEPAVVRINEWLTLDRHCYASTKRY
jgi:hypothetical protein